MHFPVGYIVLPSKYIGGNSLSCFFPSFFALILKKLPLNRRISGRFATKGKIHQNEFNRQRFSKADKERGARCFSDFVPQIFRFAVRIYSS